MRDSRELRLEALKMNYAMMGQLIQELEEDLRTEKPKAPTGWDALNPGIDIATAAEVSGFGIDAFRKLMLDEDFPGRKIGGRWYIDSAKLRQFLLGRRQKAQTVETYPKLRRV